MATYGQVLEIFVLLLILPSGYTGSVLVFSLVLNTCTRHSHALKVVRFKKKWTFQRSNAKFHIISMQCSMNI